MLHIKKYVDPKFTRSVVLTGNYTEEGVLVTEPMFGNVTNLVICFLADVSQALDRDAVFQFELSNFSTAIFGVDYLPNINSKFLTIPATFSGTFMHCITFAVFGDLEEEDFEAILYQLTALSELDTVDTPSLTIVIVDSFGIAVCVRMTMYLHTKN